MTRFDAPASSPSVLGSSFRAAGRLVVARFGMVLTTLVLTVLVSVAATSLAVSLHAVPTALRQAFVSSPMLVYLTPTTSRNDAEALRSRLTALPDVATVALRPKEEALAALVAAGLPAPADGRNPLPDVWTVSLRGGGPSFTTEAVTARDELRALPGVDVVHFDEAWAAALDRGAVAWSRFGMPSVAGGLVATALALFCVYLLSGRTLGGAVAPAGSASLGALLVVCTGVVMLTTVLDYAAFRLLMTSRGGGESALQPIAVVLGLNLGKILADIAAASVLLAGGGIAASRIR